MYEGLILIHEFQRSNLWYSQNQMQVIFPIVKVFVFTRVSRIDTFSSRAVCPIKSWSIFDPKEVRVFLTKSSKLVWSGLSSCSVSSPDRLLDAARVSRRFWDIMAVTVVADHLEQDVTPGAAWPASQVDGTGRHGSINQESGMFYFQQTT